MKKVWGNHKKRILVITGVLTVIVGILLMLRFNLVYVEWYVKKNAVVDNYYDKNSGEALKYKVHNIYGFMNKEKDIIQKPFAKRILPFNDQGIAIYQDHLSKKWGIVNKKGEILKKSFMSDVYAYNNEQDSNTKVEDFEYHKAPSCYFFKDKKTKKYGMMDGNGKILKEPIMEQRATFSANGLVAAFSIKTKEKKVIYGLMDQNGKTIKEPFAENISIPFYEHKGKLATYKLKKDGKMGLMDLEGNILSAPFAYSIETKDFVSPSSIGRFQLESDGNYGLAKLDGTILREPFAKSIKVDPTNKANFLLFELPDKEGYHGLVDRNTGEILDSPPIYEIKALNEQVYSYKIEENGGEGLLSHQGKIITEPIYSFGWRVEKGLKKEEEEEELFDENGLTCFSKQESLLIGIMDQNGRIIKEPFADGINYFSNNLAVFLKMDEQTGQYLYGFIDKKGKVIKEPTYTAMSGFNSGVSWFEDQKTALGGIIDTEGNIVRAPFVTEGTRFTDSGVARFAIKENHFGLIDKSGELLHDPFAASFDSISKGFDVYKFQYDLEGLYGLIDNKGTIVQEPFAYAIQSNSPGDQKVQKLAAYQKEKDGLWGIINEKGIVIKEPFAYEVIHFEQNQSTLGFRRIENGAIGLINQDGDIVQEPFINELHTLRDKNQELLGYTFKNGNSMNLKEGLLDKELKIVKAPFASSLGFYTSNYTFESEQPDESIMPYEVYDKESKNHYGLITSEGKIIAKPFATKIETFDMEDQARFYYEEKGITKVGIVNRKGEIIK